MTMVMRELLLMHEELGRHSGRDRSMCCLV